MGSILKAAAVLALGALCWAGPARGQIPAAEPASVQAGELRFDALPPQELPTGRCGLFIWARGDQPVFILVAFANPSEAQVRVDGRNRFLRRTGYGGEPTHGHFERQVFTDGRVTLNVELSFDPTRPLRDGAIVKEGIVKVRDREDWETIIPVGGMVACKN